MFSSSLSAVWESGAVRPVVIGLVTGDITAATFTPAGLEIYGGNAGNAWVKKSTTGALRQILTDQYLTDITAPATGGVLITSYFRSSVDAQALGPDGYAIPAGARKFRTVLISRPTATGLNTVDITTTDYSSSTTSPKVRGARWGISGTGPAADCTLSFHSGIPNAQNLVASDELVKDDLGGGLFQRVRTVRKAGSTGALVIHSVTREKYRDYGSGDLRILERTDAPGTPEELTTTYTYTTIAGFAPGGASDTGGGGAVGSAGIRLRELRRSDGYWEQYNYTCNPGTRLLYAQKWSVWNNSAPGDLANARHTTITFDATSRTTVEKINGQIVSSVHELLSRAADPDFLREERKTGTDTAPLITEYGYFSSSAPAPEGGRIKYIRHPDGTFTRYTYAIVDDPTAPGQTALKTTVERGAADATQSAPSATGPVPAPTMGTRVETVTNAFEKTIDAKTYDIASGLLLEQSTAVAVDTEGRPTHVIHGGDPDDFETFAFSCCGLQTHRARDSSVTTYDRDALERPTLTTVTLGPKTTATVRTYGAGTAGGRTLPQTTVTRSATAGSNSTGPLLVSESIKDLRGQTIVEHTPDANGDGIPETTTRTGDPATRTDTATGPGGITDITTYYADGRVHTRASMLGGNPVSATTTYTYSPHNLGGGGIRTTATTGGPGIPAFAQSWYADLAGRVFRTESPGYDGAILVSATTFDARGRATGTTASGRPATLRVLDPLGETAESWTDSNGDGTFNNDAVNGIRDSVTLSQTDFVTENGLACSRDRQWVRDDANNDILLSTTHTSTGGLYQKTARLNRPIVTTTATRPLNGNASSETRTYLSADACLTTLTATALAADGTTTATTTRKDTAGAVTGTTSQTTDLQGRLVSATGDRGLTTTYSAFTATGQALGVTSQGAHTLTTLDPQGRVTRTVTRNAADNSVISTVFTTYEQTAAGELLTRAWGTNTYPTLTRQDILGRTVELRTYRDIPAASLQSANLTLAPNGGDLTTWNYEDPTGLLLTKTDAATQPVTYTYTPDGKPLTRLWARGITTTYGYHPSGTLKSIDYSDATPDVFATYNRLGQRKEITTLLSSVSQSSVSYTYDPATLSLDKETITYDLNADGTPDLTRILDRSTPSLGRDTGYSLGSTPAPGVGGGAPPPTSPEVQATYQYHATTARLLTVTDNATTTFTYDYVPNSNLIHTLTGPTHTVTNTWEPTRDVLDKKENKVGTTIISSYDYTVNPNGQRTNVSQTGTAFQAASAIDWGYDTLGQLITADSTVNAADRAYEYDTIGNRVKSSDSLVLPTDPNYTTNALNQYTATPSATIPTYDFDGNMTVGPLQGSAGVSPASLIWDGENRLTSVTINGTTITYIYDAFSRLISRTVAASSGSSSTTCYLYDAWNRIAEYQLNTGNLTLKTSYLWGLDLSGTFQGAGGVGGLLAMNLPSSVSGSSDFYPCYDGNGNISEYLASNGTTAAHFEYDPFGNTVVNTDASNQFEYRFSTKPTDTITGLLYYGYRWYDPLTGRWPSRDPIEERGGVNLYGFCYNNSSGWYYFLGRDPKASSPLLRQLP